MPSAVVDTNVIVAGVLTSNPRSASRSLIDRLWSGQFTLVLSPDALREIQDVLRLLRLRALHRLTDDDIRRFCRALEVVSRMLVPTEHVSPTVTRDVTDTKWLALALHSDADFLVTGDRRHLHRLRRIGTTRIVTPAAFLHELDRSA
jgi:putative PIN family toxin of toxin-antitoxin system